MTLSTLKINIVTPSIIKIGIATLMLKYSIITINIAALSIMALTLMNSAK